MGQHLGKCGENILGASDATPNDTQREKSCKSREVFQGKVRDTAVSNTTDNKSNKKGSEVGFSNQEVICELDNEDFSGLAAKA